MRHERCEGRDWDGLVFALLAEHVQKHTRIWPAVGVSVEVDDVV
jgi:hypothetical protein